MWEQVKREGKAFLKLWLHKPAMFLESIIVYMATGSISITFVFIIFLLITYLLVMGESKNGN